VVSDIHANLTALEAVTVDLRTMSPDLVIHGGDLVGSGAHPAEVVDRIRELGWAGVYGNSDEMVWNAARVSEIFAASSLQQWHDVVLRTASWTRAALSEERIDWLRALQPRMTIRHISVVHARPDDCWRSPTAEATDDEFVEHLCHAEESSGDLRPYPSAVRSKASLNRCCQLRKPKPLLRRRSARRVRRNRWRANHDQTR
jgi:hypothetical protein